MNNTPTNAEVTANALLHKFDLNTIEGRTAEFVNSGTRDEVLIDIREMFEDHVASEDFAQQDSDFRKNEIYRYNLLCEFLYNLDKNNAPVMKTGVLVSEN